MNGAKLSLECPSSRRRPGSRTCNGSVFMDSGLRRNDKKVDSCLNLVPFYLQIILIAGNESYVFNLKLVPALFVFYHSLVNIPFLVYRRAFLFLAFPFNT
jgi:hypothetical protein